MTNNNTNQQPTQPVIIEATAVVPCSTAVQGVPIDVPCDDMTLLLDDDASYRDPLMTEVEAVPEERVMRLPAGDVCLEQDCTEGEQYTTGKYGYIHYGGSCSRSQSNYPHNTNLTPSQVSVTLLNVKHSQRISLWQASNRNHNMRERVQFQQHTSRPSFDPLGLTLMASSKGQLRVATVDTTSPYLPWTHAHVEVGDILISINHVSVQGLLPAMARDCLYEALLRTSDGDQTTTTLVFAKPSAQRSHPHQQHIVATTVEKPSPNTKLGFKFIGSSVNGTLHISELNGHCLLAPSCMMHAHDTILALNGQSTKAIWTTVPPDASFTQHALRVLAASPRYVTIVTAKGIDAAVVATILDPVAVAPATLAASAWFPNLVLGH